MCPDLFIITYEANGVKDLPVPITDPNFTTSPGNTGLGTKRTNCLLKYQKVLLIHIRVKIFQNNRIQILKMDLALTFSNKPLGSINIGDSQKKFFNSLFGPFLAILNFWCFVKVSILQTLEAHSSANFNLTGFS